MSDAQINTAYQWLCQQRKHFPANADIWDFRVTWTSRKAKLLTDISTGEYQFSPLQGMTQADNSVIHLWCAQDAFVLKLLAGELPALLACAPTCTHVKGHGGLKQTVLNTHQQLQDTLKQFQYVCKTDVKHFYESIDQAILIDQLYQQIQHRVLRRYLYQAIRRTVTYGGLFIDIWQGISRGCPISPMLGAYYLKQLDQAFANTGTHQTYYVRYMDDILILSKTRWQLRAAVKRMNQVLSQLKLKQHPDKTFIGRISRGFDFLGYHYHPQGLRIATITVRKHLERCRLLYEQQCKQKATSIEVALALGHYRQRWLRWCNAGLAEIKQPPFVYDDVILPLIDLNPQET